MSSTFYSNSTMIAIAILVVILFLIAGLLYTIQRYMGRMINEKEPGAIEPSFYQRKIKPVMAEWNPTIVTLVVIGLLVVVLGAWGYKYGMQEIGVQQGYAPDQPINYSHAMHAGTLKIDCQYCHSTASYSRHASIPSANTCMNCHKGVQLRDRYNGEVSPEIQKIYNAVGFDGQNGTYIEGYEQKPIKWVRIHNLPDLAYFNHSQHVAVGKVECQTCHGPIQEMEKVYQFSTLQMGWCINCHRERGVDVENNNYYEELHKDLKADGKTWISVAENGGLECAKCHY
ncbi:MAG: hypothetical protein H6606_05675 [Flavobacteriales bacterium]|nr:hypothetical protein [Flavobacteriales bacterium]